MTCIGHLAHNLVEGIRVEERMRALVSSSSIIIPWPACMKVLLTRSPWE